MATGINTNKGQKIFIFSLLLLATVGMATFLLATVWGVGKATTAGQTSKAMATPAAQTGYKVLLEHNSILSGALNEILELDQDYSKALSQNASQSVLNDINKEILSTEEMLRGAIDKIASASNTDEELNKLRTNMVSSYKSILQNRSAISSLRNAVSVKSDDVKPDQLSVLKMQTELQEKSNRIFSLETAMKTMNESKKIVGGADLAGAKDIAALKENITVQESKITALVSTNNTLKQDNERLLKDQHENSKALNSAELTLKTKAAGLQQRVDELNAELSLAQVDCNLSRVDAAQIISNSKQRKELLSEASGILTSLARSDDPAIRKKVQYKIVRLNQITANSRD